MDVAQLIEDFKVYVLFEDQIDKMVKQVEQIVLRIKVVVEHENFFFDKEVKDNDLEDH